MKKAYRFVGIAALSLEERILALHLIADLAVELHDLSADAADARDDGVSLGVEEGLSNLLVHEQFLLDGGEGLFVFHRAAASALDL